MDYAIAFVLYIIGMFCIGAISLLSDINAIALFLYVPIYYAVYFLVWRER